MYSSVIFTSIADPVGVANSVSASPPIVGVSDRISSTAGAGTGSIPCCVLTVPAPVATGSEYIVSLSNPSR